MHETKDLHYYGVELQDGKIWHGSLGGEPAKESHSWALGKRYGVLLIAERMYIIVDVRRER